MKVKDLVEQLQKLDQNLNVYVTCDDPEVTGPDYFVRPFFIQDVGVVEVELTRDENRRPEIAATAAGDGQKCALLEITGQF
ncbi:hypothetical protein HB13667_29100 [Pseudomonas putida]|uniref:Uncharacterized protein n=2 Tax=Pseudomonas putida group TaxID=136845 RepID=A0ABX4U4C0_PSEDL|nr:MULTISPECIES: hypothetical protein [Pseudomonas]KPM57834.1 hypothetical protein HB13667_29100 [Pseudomonas putida]MCE0853789.1 hypothetical protein [Pseudomonas asiatica]PLU86351.1 hypothetical protein CXG44_16045 [Pseudomonas plecoglossicida]PLU94104.1 hypothetical protein CXG45_07985 [Pseudomonas plecoglossicida]PLV04945.1 hypothetical protein CXG48_07845 [Pseudomonas plecoglossicida]